VPNSVAEGTVPEGCVLVLGPVAVLAGPGRLAIPPPLPRALLGALALGAGDPVPADRLRATLWPGGDADRTGLPLAVHRLRQWLDRYTPGGPGMSTVGGGYRLGGDSDLLRFRALVRRAAEVGRPEQLPLLDRALALWRGDPLADVPPERRDADAVAALAGERLLVARDAARAALRHGDPQRAVAWLLPVARAHPFDEATQADLIEALVAAGRTGDARDRYERTRRLLADRLGMDPGERLRAAHARTTAATPAVPAAPCTLPPDLPDFTGRAAEVAALRGALRGDGPVVVSGPAGIGKTSLAVHVAHAARADHPDGQLFAQGGAVDLVGQFLPPLVTDPATVPADAAGRAALLRSLIAGRAVLLVADGVPDPAAVAALAPGTPVLVTTRTPTAGALVLAPLTAEEGLALLTRAAPPGRLAGEPDAARAVVEHCAGSPQALRHAAALLGRRPHWSVRELADRLAV